MVAGQHDFKTVLAGIAGAGNVEIAVAGGPERLECLNHRRAVAAQHRAQLCARLGALYGNDGQGLTLGDLDVETLGVAAQPSQIDLATRASEPAAIKITVPADSE